MTLLDKLKTVPIVQRVFLRHEKAIVENASEEKLNGSRQRVLDEVYRFLITEEDEVDFYRKQSSVLQKEDPAPDLKKQAAKMYPHSIEELASRLFTEIAPQLDALMQSKGWCNRRDLEQIALIHSDVSKAATECMSVQKDNKKLAEALVDVILRTACLATQEGIDIEQAVLCKLGKESKPAN